MQTPQLTSVTGYTAKHLAPTVISLLQAQQLYGICHASSFPANADGNLVGGSNTGEPQQLLAVLHKHLHTIGPLLTEGSTLKAPLYDRACALLFRYR